MKFSSIGLRVLNRQALVVSAATLLTVGLSPTVCRADYVTAVLADNPIAYYRLNEVSNPPDNVVTTAVNIGTGGAALNATYQAFSPNPGFEDNTSIMGVAGAQAGSQSGANTITGLEANNIGIQSGPNTNAVVTLPDFDANPLDITGALTIEAWVYRDAQVSGNDNEGIVSKFASSGRSYVLFYNSGDSTIGFGINPDGNSANSVLFQPDVDIPLGSEGGWTHIAAVFQPSTRMELYMNGQSIGALTDGVPAEIFNGGAAFWIGKQFSGANNRTFEGKIDEVAVYGAALSGSQIAAHYNASLVPEPGSIALLISGAFGLAVVRRKRRR